MSSKRKHANPWIVCGVIGSVIWASLVLWYIICAFGWANFRDLPPNAHGDFLAGFFAPLALGWFVLTLILQSQQIKMQAQELELQRKELEETRKTLEAQRVEMKKAADQAAIQAEAIKANELHTRRDTFFRIAELHERDLNYHASAILKELRLEGAIRDYWRFYADGDKFILASELVNALKNVEQGALEGIRSSSDFETSARRYTRVFRKILDEADPCDPDGVIRGEYEWSPYGELCGILSAILGKELMFKWRKSNFEKWHKK